MSSMLKLTILGTSSGVPTRHRHMSALALQAQATGRDWWLIDCAEATQHQLLGQPLSVHDLAGICISHVHGDHCYGLPGLLATMGLNGRQHPLQLIAPAPLWQWLQATWQLTDLHLPFEIVFTDVAQLLDKPKRLSAGRDAELWLSTHAQRHRVPSHAFRFELRQRIVKLDTQTLQTAGLPPGPLWGQLRDGQDVVWQGRRLQSTDVVSIRQHRLVAVMGGDNEAPALLSDACQDAQLLVHEATYSQAVQDRIGAGRGHSSAAEVARFAEQIGLPNLILTHFSPRHHTPAEQANLLAEVQAHYSGRAFMAEDGAVFVLGADGSVSREL
ncbi:MAG: ribonuclease Z [Lautropia sp.]|nr:ribonuclease Z [Lautropia sp.]